MLMSLQATKERYNTTELDDELRTLLQETRDRFQNIRVERFCFPGGGWFGDNKLYHDTLDYSIDCYVSPWKDHNYEFNYKEIRDFIEPRLISLYYKYRDKYVESINCYISISLNIGSRLRI